MVTPKRNTSLDPVERYARDVLAERITAGRPVKFACERHLRDLAEGPKRGLHWDADSALWTIGYFRDVLRLNGGGYEGRPFALAPSQAFIVGSLFGWKGPDGYRRFRTAYLEIGKGSGKALAIDTAIPTPDGWRTMEDLQTGDQVFDETGNVCKVTATTEIMSARPCYRLTFSTGETIIADADHLWKTSVLRSYGPRGPKPTYMVRKGGIGLWTTSEIAKTVSIPISSSKHPQAKWNHRIEIGGAFNLPDKELLVPPYTLGVWLGDGESATARITMAYADAEIAEGIRSEGVTVDERAKHSETVARLLLGSGGRTRKACRKSLQAKLRILGLLNNKHIPAIYLRTGYKQRLALLQGLMDTDGYISKDGHCEFTTVNKILSEEFRELLLTLGCKPGGGTEERAKLNGRDCGPKYRITFRPGPDLPCFRLKRKQERIQNRPVTRPLSKGRMIVGCEPVPSVPVKCISVNSPSQLYLAGRGMIPTHNSPLLAGIGTYMMTADSEPRAEVYSAAVDKAQAAILFRDAVAMVNQSPTLDKRIQRSGGPGREYNLADLSSGSFFRPIASEARGRGKSGPRPHCALLDEIHEHPSNAMVEFMRAGTKGRRQALIVMATNSGYDRLSVCYHYHDYGIKLLTGQEESNDAFFAYICSLDSCASCWASGYVQPNADCPDCDDWRDPKVWMKANPLLGVTITHKYLEEQVRDATGMPSKQSIVRRLNFCEWTESATPFIGADVWKANGAMPSEEALRKYPVFGALDLSGKNALTALVIGCQDENSKVHVKPYAWTPEKGLKDRQEKDGAPYARWVEEKHLKTTPGATIDFEFVAAELARIHADYNLHGVAFDRWRIEDFKRSCQKIGLEAWIEGTDEPIPGGLRLVPHGQGFRDMSPAIDHLEDDLKESRLCHGNHPVLTMCVANCTTEMDAAGLRKFSKARSTGRIDLAQALAMVETVIKGAPREAEKAYQAYFF